MTGVAAACVGLAAVVVLWPGPGRRARWRRLFPPAIPATPRSAPATLVPALRNRVRARLRPVWEQVRRGGVPAGRTLPALAVGGCAVLGTAAAGPVAGLLAGSYGAVAVRQAARRTAGRARAARRAEWLDLLAAAAAELRAGLPTGTALAGLAGDSTDPVGSRVGAAAMLADRTGAPLAELLERIEADARGADRAHASAAAQTAGARATAWLLAGLPAGGIALGYAIGADPLAVLLHTPIGAACASGALGLQLAGLAWTGRIIRGAGAVGS